MKAVVVAGFFDRVDSAVREHFGAHLAARSIILVPQVRRNAGADVGGVRRQLHDRLGAGFDEVLVIVADLRGLEHITSAIHSVVAGAKEQFSTSRVDLLCLKNAGDAERIVEHIAALGLTEPQSRTGRRLVLSTQSSKFLERLQRKQRQQVRQKIEGLPEDPTPVDSETLTGHPYRRADIGEYRIIYDFNAEEIKVIRVAKRNDAEAYRNL